MSRARDLFNAALAQSQAQAPIAGQLSYDIFEGDTNIELGNGYTLDQKTGEYGVDVAPGMSYDIE